MRQHRPECEARKMTWDDEICTCTLAERDEARAEAQRLRAENERLQKALQVVVDMGHDNDCLFCGLKDKAAIRAGASAPSESAEREP